MEETLQNRKNRPYDIVPYDPQWAVRYEEMKKRILAVLGDNIEQIEHAGSTAIPGLAGKPQIDIYATAKNLDNIRSKYEAMKAAGFTPKGDYVGHGEEYFVEDDPNGIRLGGIHIVEVCNPVFEEHIIFRDYMRANDKDKALYLETKMRLKKEFPGDYNAYSKGKEAVLEEIKSRARIWGDK